MISQTTLPSGRMVWVTEPVCELGFPFSGRSWAQLGVSSHTLGSGQVVRTRVASCDLGGRRGRRSRAHEDPCRQAIAARGCLGIKHRGGAAGSAASGARVGGREASGAFVLHACKHSPAPSAPRTAAQLRPRPAPHPRPASQLQPHPGPLGPAHRQRGGSRGGGSVTANHMIFPAYINHCLFFSTGCRLKGAVSSFSLQGQGLPWVPLTAAKLSGSGFSWGHVTDQDLSMACPPHLGYFHRLGTREKTRKHFQPSQKFLRIEAAFQRLVSRATGLFWTLS